MLGAVLLAVAAMIAAVVAVAWIVRTQRGAERSDLGSVSHHWVAMHRVESGNTVNR